MRSSSTRTHQCYAACCRTMVPSHLLMCDAHWRLVPHVLKTVINETYKSGETKRYHEAVREAQAAVREAELRSRERKETPNVSSH